MVASAQRLETIGFVTVDLGLQSGDGDTTQTGSFTAYEETGRFEAVQSHSGGFIFSLGGIARVWQMLGVGLAYTRMSDTQESTTTVFAPHPLVFNQPRSASATQDNLEHTENALHVQIAALFSYNEQIEFAVTGGPTFFSVSHDFVTGAGFVETGAPFTTISVSDVTAIESDATVAGFNIGADVAYYVADQVGVGAFMRYSAATADLDAGDGTEREVDVGGFQIGAGVRVRF
jgi:hypothetical protein